MNPDPTVWDQIIRWAGFIASVAAIIGVPVLVIQVKVARDTFIGEQTGREERRQTQRATILSALRVQVELIRRSVATDLNRFWLRNLTPDVQPFVQLREAIGEQAYAAAFVWTPLPANTIEQAIQEANLLGLSDEEIRSLQELQLVILRGNTAVNTKFEVLLGLSAAHGSEPTRLANFSINREINSIFNEVDRLCTQILQRLPAE